MREGQYRNYVRLEPQLTRTASIDYIPHRKHDMINTTKDSVRVGIVDGSITEALVGSANPYLKPRPRDMI